jgi:hypothetical protein
MDEYKALTQVNIPFIEERFKPGQMIPRSAFEEAYGDNGHAVRLLRPDPTDKHASPIPTADEVIAELIKWGSLSEDPDAPLHPDSVIPDPNALSLTGVMAQAEALIAQLREAGHPVPKELSALVEMPDKKVSSAEEALSHEQIV